MRGVKHDLDRVRPAATENAVQIVSQKIDLPISMLPDLIKEQINLNPDFQRRDRWDQEEQSRFIESIIMNVPIPPVFLGEDQYGIYVVLDGRQRLTAINCAAGSGGRPIRCHPECREPHNSRIDKGATVRYFRGSSRFP